MKHSILHLVNQSPFDKPCLLQCLQNYSEGDCIVFLENGVYGLLPNHSASNDLKEKKCYAIKADTDARGLKNNIDKNVKLIGFSQLVSLCTEYNLVQSWY
ncbi:MAG: tRNA 2-thiouridine synthesizing protein B [Cellvibrionaceae bacterium]|jgi:tRNA 2-thiouridine synthesizing protein B